MTTRLLVLLGLLHFATNPLLASQEAQLSVKTQENVSQKLISFPAQENQPASRFLPLKLSVQKNLSDSNQAARDKWIKLALSPSQCRSWRTGCVSACYRDYKSTNQWQQHRACTQRCENNYQRSCGNNRPTYNRPTFNLPTHFDRPTYNQPTYNRPTYQRPSLTPAQIQQQQNAKRQRCRQKYLARCNGLPLRGVCHNITLNEMRRFCPYGNCRRGAIYAQAQRSVCAQRRVQWKVRCRSDAVRGAEAALRGGGC